MAAVVIGKWEKDFDPEQARKALHAAGNKKNENQVRTPEPVEADKVDAH
jgi:aerobic C4-dicarboxylate transport protein